MTRLSLPPSGEKLLLSEKFVSIQGEGASTGAPAAFVRLGNCNLKCSYCDTPYTWDATRFDLSSELVPESVEGVAAWVVQSAPGRLIVTGGEPLIQQKALARLLIAVDEAWATSQAGRLFVEVETNGTVVPTKQLLARVDQWNVSPKLSCADEPAARRIKAEALRTFTQTAQAYFKFVVRGEADVREVDELRLEWGWAPERVYLMPEASGVDELRSRGPEVAEAALKRRYRYSGRLHLELFGGRRGA